MSVRDPGSWPWPPVAIRSVSVCENLGASRVPAKLYRAQTILIITNSQSTDVVYSLSPWYSTNWKLAVYWLNVGRTRCSERHRNTTCLMSVRHVVCSLSPCCSIQLSLGHRTSHYVLLGRRGNLSTHYDRKRQRSPRVTQERRMKSKDASGRHVEQLK